jgi:hypothetical protein
MPFVAAIMLIQCLDYRREPPRRRAQRFAGRNTQRSTLQTPQGFDATHGDELFPVQREYIGINSRVRRASFGGPKLLAGGSSSSTAWWNDVPHGTIDEMSSLGRLESTQKGLPTASRFRTSPAKRVTKWQRRLWPVSLYIFPPPILRRPIRFGQMRTCR